MRTLALAWFLAAGFLALQAILVLNDIQADRQAQRVAQSEAGR
jgi:hypothetical protein